jgi:2-hydroxy-3-keto-5-methylthiopentenyl-1-phosphate phosphatase
MLFIVDFDGTISVKDTIDAMLEKFADPSWEDIEQEWLDGHITAVECMSKQIGMVRADNVALESFFRGIQLDASFLPFYKHVSQFAKVVIASDGLDHAIKVSTRNAGWPEIPIYSNHLNFEPEGIKMTFPLRKADCTGGNGMCKCAVAKNLSADAGGPIVLIGDGKSDACIAHMADIVFAKGSLIKHCEKNGIKHHKFQTFADVLAMIKKWPNEVKEQVSPKRAQAKIA